MPKTKEELLQRKAEILAFLEKHGKLDPNVKENFIAEYPNYSEFTAAADESEEANEFADYEVALATINALEEELLDIDEQLANISE